ncbi:hypothetical protein [Dictyobacter arantiisoli]|uniref:Uncharacterized protein n=1 Tax=Dictyobacter arantiisoli TaxID=2014874 RepID=A0A5A5TDQ3_9CHLR|nr:hypothetical protein [Dictyobacter arantiisoli]GCF09183.1 hypothetical protein KDI_27470 [Dictyobacter arantiisoli]
MGGSSFDLIAQEIQKQQHIMEELKAENRQLHQQLSALRAGQGIFLEINGTRIALATPFVSSSSSSTHFTATLPETPQTTWTYADKVHNEEAQAIPSSFDGDSAKEEENVQPQEQAEVPMSEQAQLLSEAPTKEIAVETTFLEEIMLDEFAAALTAPNQALQTADPRKNHTKEEQKATLRRELMGSFLLE